MTPRNQEKYTFADRELSWISFNGRVLQEAADPDVPLFDRLAFLAIFSSNLDEFFRVRVASLRSLLRLKKKKLGKLRMNPRRLLREIQSTVSAQQELFGDVFRGRILPELASHGIYLVDERSVSDDHAHFLKRHFRERVRPLLEPMPLDLESPPFLEDRRVYLTIELWASDEHGIAGRPTYALVKVPDELPRFVTLPESAGRREVMFLDDVIRFCLPELFPDADVGGAYAVKLSRDAELYLEDEFADNVVEAIKKSLGKRKTGDPARFLYDLQSPYAMVAYLARCLALEDEDLILGGRYHNLHDLHGFPRFGLAELAYEPLEPLAHPTLSAQRPIHEIVGEKDRILHFPYQAFDPVVRFIEEAAKDPHAEEVWATLYRVSEDSGVVRALLAAAEAGKRVRVFVEVKARFDEASNLRWAQRMEKAGIVTLYSFPQLKVHAKLALVTRRESGRLRHYAYLGTGNFNEKTARIYCDHGLLTANSRVTDEVRRVFGLLAGEEVTPGFEQLLVAPFSMRQRFYEMIEREVGNVRLGRPAGMVLKMNSLEDEDVISRLYDASNAGVPVRLIVRGICRLIPGIPGQSENITVTSIVDRYLEHARVYVFRNGGEEAYYLASADLMTRNLSHRVEVGFPVLDPDVRQELREILNLQLTDTVKARVIDAEMSNGRLKPGPYASARLVSTRELLANDSAIATEVEVTRFEETA